MELKRTLGAPALTLYGLGTILGAGIYSVLGAAAGVSGAGLWLSFLVSAAIATLTALSYAELSTALPRAGAEYVYLREAVPRHRVVGFTVGLLMAASGAATAATVALAFAGYLGIPVPALVIALVLLAVIAGVAIIGVRQSATVAIVFTLIEAGGLVAVIAVGVSVPGFGAALGELPGPAEAVAGASLVFFSYLGFENIANLAEEAERPERSLPRAILLSVAIATALYVLVALAAVALMPAEQLADSDAPLSDAVATASPRVAGALRGIALFATANTALASTMSASRVLFGMARDGDLPRPLAALLPGRQTPWLATLVVAALAAALTPLGGVEVVASVSSFAALLAFAAVNAAVVILRRRDPDRARPFRVPLAIAGVPVLPAIGALAALGLLVRLPVAALLIGAGLIAIIATAYVIISRRRDGAFPRQPR
jgi:APA family basic amino acid/polyamine antiporter